MKKIYLQVMLLAMLAVQPMLANADHDKRRQDRSGTSALEWRLGAARGWQGHEIYYRHAGDRQWRRAPGSAIDLSDGWVIGTDRRNGGYGIYRWNGHDWQRMPGAGVDIGGTFHSPRVINERGERFSWTGFQWREESNFRRNDERGRNGRRPLERRRDARWEQNRNSTGSRRDGRNR